ncbi:hypothetical protein PV433_26530 [Paenibacillus sp. GYB004]|jgi:hypothetical protein|uniref:hypothetical protein n=1 Tax=Paenibacillus sp. GYB004 TaxID=2994393 RepID=UPI002F966875
MELVGTCQSCQTPVYCKGGFLDGVAEQGKLLCFPCYDKLNKKTSEKEKNPQ